MVRRTAEEKQVSVFIPGNVPSSKNSRQFNIAMKRSFVSKSTTRWKQDTKVSFIRYRGKFLKLLDLTSQPYRIEFTFFRKTRHKFDYINPAQTVQDAMVHHKWIEDDNCEILIPSFGLYQHDPVTPGVVIKVLGI